MVRRVRFSAPALALALAALTISPIRAGDADLEVELGFGYDSNPFLSPADPYFDQNSETVIAPDRQPAPFVPFRLRGDWPVGTGNRRFVADLYLNADTYTGTDSDNADEVYAKLSPGLDWRWKKDATRGSLWAAPFVAYKDETYFDRDTGFGRETGGQDLSERYSYSALGFELEYEIDPRSRFEYAVSARVEQRNYETVPDTLSLDHWYYRLGLDAEVVLAGRNKLYLDYRYRVRDYDTRPARNLEGRARSSNPTLEYAYHDFGITLRANASRWLDLYFDVDHRIREDRHLGYNDYERTSFRIRSILETRDDRRLKLSVRSFRSDYDNAFIFDRVTDPRDGLVNPNKRYETIELEVEGEWPLRNGWFVFGRYEYRDQESEDPRWGYRRHQIATGVKWKL